MIQQLVELYYDLSGSEWSLITADSRGRYLLIGSFNSNGVCLPRSSQNICLKSGSIISAPVAARTGQGYHVLMPLEHTSEPLILFVAIELFLRVLEVQSPDRAKPAASCFISQLFSRTIAHHEGITPDDATVSTRKFEIPNGDIYQLL